MLKTENCHVRQFKPFIIRVHDMQQCTEDVEYNKHSSATLAIEVGFAPRNTLTSTFYVLCLPEEVSANYKERSSEQLS